MADPYDSRDIYEYFQNTFVEEQPVCNECKHMNTYTDEAGLRVCSECGLVFETIDFTNECNWYNRDRSRCSRRWYPKPKGSAQKVLESHHVEIPRIIRDVIENKYQHICKVEGMFARGEYHVGIMFVCFMPIKRLGCIAPQPTFESYSMSQNMFFLTGRAWWAQLVRSLPSDHKVPSSILALPRFEYLCDLLFYLSQLSFPSFRGR